MIKEHEQAIKNLESFIDHFHTTIKQAEKANDNAFDFTQAEDDIITFGIAIQAIKDLDKMQNVLDEIRTEIIARDRNVKAVRSDGCCFFTAEEVLGIIDRYSIR